MSSIKEFPSEKLGRIDSVHHVVNGPGCDKVTSKRFTSRKFHGILV
jgi:hypothetical protein